MARSRAESGFFSTPSAPALRSRITDAAVAEREHAVDERTPSRRQAGAGDIRERSLELIYLTRHAHEHLPE